MKQNFLLWLGSIVEALSYAPRSCWAEAWVAFRLELQRRWLKGVILTTEHGVQIFESLLRHVEEPRLYEEAMKRKEAHDKDYLKFIQSLQ